MIGSVCASCEKVKVIAYKYGGESYCKRCGDEIESLCVEFCLERGTWLINNNGDKNSFH